MLTPPKPSNRFLKEDRRKLEAILSIHLSEITQRVESLEAVMQEISDKAKARTGDVQGRKTFRTAIDPVSLLIPSIAGWMNQHQHRVNDYLIGSLDGDI